MQQQQQQQSPIDAKYNEARSFSQDEFIVNPSISTTSNSSNADVKAKVDLLKTISFKHIRSKSKTESETKSIALDYHDLEEQAQKKKERKKSLSDEGKREELLKEYKSKSTDRDYYSLDELVEEEIYIVKQKRGYLAYAFSIVQTIILIIMMWQCSIAPLEINPMIGPAPDVLDYWGGKNALKILKDNEDWRLLTPIFLHAGVIHLFCNVSVQVDILEFFEREWGSFIWLFIYITSAIGSSIFSCCMKPDNISVGSSGAVMGLFGGKLGEIFCRQCESRKTRQAKIAAEVRQEQFGAVSCSVIVVLLFSFVPYVDWAAHVGGLIAGFCSAFLCFAPMIKTKIYALFWFLVGVLLNVVLYAVTVTYMYTEVEPDNNLKDVCAYYQQYFQDYECQCQLD